MKSRRLYVYAIIFLSVILVYSPSSYVLSGKTGVFASETYLDGENEPPSSIIRCSTRDVTPEEARLLQETISPLLPDPDDPDYNKRRGMIQDFPASGLTIPVAFHVMHNGQEGLLTQEDIDAQLNVMNQAYRSMGVQFLLVQVDYTDDPEWFKMEKETSEVEAKAALNLDPHYYLNLYSAVLEENKLGYAKFPWDLESAPAVDGVVVTYSSLPGGDFEDYNEGDTAVHETGHWLGLYHTFEAPRFCYGNGDYVDDTPAQRTSTSGCPDSRNSCPLRPGKDPIHNYMDYSSDPCLTEFTPGQAERIQANILAYRPGLLENTPSPGGDTTTSSSVPGTATTTTTVDSNSGAPVIDSFTISPTSGQIYETFFTFTCEAHDPDGSIVAYWWDFDGSSGGSVEQFWEWDATTLSSTFSATAYIAGTFTAYVSVWDDQDNYTIASASFEVTEE